jgi:excisionase family DNA binding protein
LKPLNGLGGTVTTSAGEHLVLTIEEAAERLCIGRTLMYSLVKAGAVESVCIGRLRRIPLDALESFLRQLRESNPDGAT